MSMDGIIPYVLGGGGGGGGSSAATVAAMISGTEDTATASQGYSVGEYFIYNDALYIVTSPISQGDTITPGTNCDTTTVCENLTDLNGAITNGTLINGEPQIKIPANSNLNDYLTSGTYYVESDSNAATIANIPRVASGTLYVIRRAKGGYRTQIYYPTTSAQIHYSRNYNGGTWTDWQMVSNSFGDHKTFTAKLYDLDTYIRDIPNQYYWKIGDLIIVMIDTTWDHTDNIQTMIEIRDLPCNVVGGTCYIANLETTRGADRTIQGSGQWAYIRPNLKSSDMNSTDGVFQLVIFGFERNGYPYPD